MFQSNIDENSNPVFCKVCINVEHSYFFLVGFA